MIEYEARPNDDGQTFYVNAYTKDEAGGLRRDTVADELTEDQANETIERATSSRITKLSNGRAVVTTTRANDPRVSDVEMQDGGEMSDPEWEEYCSALLKERTVNK